MVTDFLVAVHKQSASVAFLQRMLGYALIG